MMSNINFLSIDYFDVGSLSKNVIMILEPVVCSTVLPKKSSLPVICLKTEGSE